ncbi:MAG: hypothetical protein ABI743_00410 [bacterium]
MLALMDQAPELQDDVIVETPLSPAEQRESRIFLWVALGSAAAIMIFLFYAQVFWSGAAFKNAPITEAEGERLATTIGLVDKYMKGEEAHGAKITREVDPRQPTRDHFAQTVTLTVAPKEGASTVYQFYYELVPIPDMGDLRDVRVTALNPATAKLLDELGIAYVKAPALVDPSPELPTE